MSGFVKRLSSTTQNSLKWPLDWINQNLWRKVVRRTTTITIYFWVSVVSSINLYKRRQTDDMIINLVHQRIRFATEKMKLLVTIIAAIAAQDVAKECLIFIDLSM